MGHVSRLIPTIGAAITARYWFLWVRCPACRTINAIDLRTLDRHRDAAVTSLIPALSCRSCRPNAPFAELVRLSRTSIADEMRDAVVKLLPESTVIVKTAAVADFRPKLAAGEKIKRKGPMTLEFEPTSDILAELSRRKSTSQIVIGFAAETDNVLENARKKLAAKSLDAIVANDVSREGIGFDSDRNAVTIISHDEVVEVPETSKWEVAQRVLDQVVKLRSRIRVPSH